MPPNITDGLLRRGYAAADVLDRWEGTVAIVSTEARSLHDRLLSAGWRQAFQEHDGAVLEAP